MESSAVVSRVKDALEEAFREPVYVDRIPKDFQRPSFAVELQKTEYQDMNLVLVRKTATILITCFAEVDAYGKVQRIRETIAGDANISILLAGCAEPDLKSPALKERFGGVTPEETVKAMLLPGEIEDLARAVERLCGYRRLTIEEVKNA